MKVTIQGVSVMAPGLGGWQQSLPVLRGEQAWLSAPLEKLKPALLPPNERRRTTELIKLALQAAEEAQQQSAVEAAALACVFASSDGDTFIVDRLCEALALPERPVSPTQFHNSVHNAAAGYWAIAAGARRFSTSISAGAASFSAGLLEAMAYVAIEQEPVLLVCYDVALPATLAGLGITHESFAAAMVLAPAAETGQATLALSEMTAQGKDVKLPPGLAGLRQQNPAGEALPLLALLAGGESAVFNLPCFDGAALTLELVTC